MVSKIHLFYKQIHLLHLFLLGAFLTSCLSSCAFRRLDVQTQPLTHQYFASYTIGSPDPRLQAPLHGQRLLVQWALSQCEIQQNNTFLSIILRYYNHQQEEIRVPIQNKRGLYTYDLLNASFIEKRGILTYRVAIYNQEILLAEWKHPLWSEWITLEPV